MSCHFTLKVDRAEGRPAKDDVIFYPVSEIFWNSCHSVGDDLIIDAKVESLYDEDCLNYPAHRVRLEQHGDQFMVGLVPK